MASRTPSQYQSHSVILESLAMMPSTNINQHVRGSSHTAAGTMPSTWLCPIGLACSARRETPSRTSLQTSATRTATDSLPGPEYHSPNPIPPLTSCVPLEEIFNLSEPQFHLQLNRGNNSTQLTELLG